MTSLPVSPSSAPPPPPPPFDLQAYISRYDYQSETSLQRLLFVAHYFHEESVCGSDANVGGSSGGGDGSGAAGGSGSGSGSGEGDDGHFGNAEDSTNTANSIAHSIAQEAFEVAVDRMKENGNYRRYLEEFGAVLPGEERSGDTANPEVTGITGGVVGSPARLRSGSHNSHTATHSIHSSPHPHGHHHAHASHHRLPITHHMSYDPHFPQNSKMEAQAQLETLEARLATAQSHIVKESIRTALLALGEFHRRRGELREAWRRVARSREYCIGGREGGSVCLLMVELGVDLREWASVRDTVARAEHTALSNTNSSGISGFSGLLHDDNDQLFRQKLRAALGLTHLAEGNYLEAAKVFTSISTDLTNQFNSVISAEDLALYGAILGLATLERGRLHSLVIDGSFKGRLELVPFMRDALRHYSRAEYGQCIAMLQHTLQRDLLLDIHLHSHVPALLDMIRDRCIAQYFQPYSSVSLSKMGDVFGFDVDEMEEVAARLVSGDAGGRGAGGRGRAGDGGVVLSLGQGARINSLEKTLSVESRSSAERRARRRARVKAAKMGINFMRNTEGMLMRIACLENGLFIQNENPSRWRGNRAGGRGRHGHDHNMNYPEEMGGYGSGGSTDDDPMEVEDHIGNPNDF